MGPPIWMMTGPWLVGVVIDGWPVQFYCLNPLVAGNEYYLTFRDYTQGQVYAALYDDPVPERGGGMDGWLGRASAWIDTIRFGDPLAERALTCDLPTWDCHNFYNDYLLHTTADSTTSEYRIIFKRERIEDGSFQYAGVDSTEIVLTEREILSRADTVTPLIANRFQGESMIGGQYVGARSGEGMAFLMPMGKHDDTIVREFQRKMMPEITVNAK